MKTTAPARVESFRASPATRYWIVAVILVLIFATVRSIDGPREGALDVYTRAVLRMAEGEQIYRTTEQAFTYPAVFALPFVPFAWMPLAPAAFLWMVVGGLIMAAAVFGLVAALRPLVPQGAWRWRAAWVIVAIVLSIRFVISPLEYSSHDGIIFALLVAGMIASIHGRDATAGALLGLAAAFKATPLLFLPVLLLRRQFKAAASFTVVCLAATFLPDLVFPADSGRPWIAEWYATFVSKVEVTEAADVPGAWETWNHLNQGLTGTLHRLTAPVTYRREMWLPGLPLVNLGDSARKALSLAALGTVFLVTLAACWRFWPARPTDRATTTWQHFAAWGVITSAILLLSPMSSKQHFATLAIPIALASLAFFHYPGRLRPLLGAGLALIFIVGTCATKDLIGRPLGNLALAYGSLTWCATACWIMSMTLLAAPPSRDQGPTP